MTEPDTGHTPAEPETLTAPAPRTLLCVGGARHGETVDVDDDAQSWVDLPTAETYLIREFAYVRRDPRNPNSQTLMRGYRAYALVHEGMVANQVLYQAWWNSLALTRLFEAYGWQAPAAELLQVPNPNGKGPAA
jgi:hypothetical protein